MLILNFILLMLLAAALGAVAAGGIASLAVGWYRMSPREGASGYFVVILGLFGLGAGGLIGLGCAIGFAPDTFDAFGSAIGTSAGIILVVGAIAAAVSRLLADVPPTMDGETLFLVVEVRASEPASPFTDAGARIVLGSLSGRTLRKSEFGPLWVGSVAALDGGWVVQGAVPIFTSRGRRILRIELGGGVEESFELPLPRHPRRRNMQWSAWLPPPLKNKPARSERFMFCFKVLRHCDPMHTEHFGNFLVDSFAERFEQTSVDGVQQIISFYRFAVKHPGTPLNGVGLGPGQLPAMNLLVTFPNHPAAMLVNTVGQAGAYVLQLIRESDGKPKVEHVAASSMFPSLVKMSPPQKPSGRQLGSRIVLDKPGLYRVGEDGILDTRTLAIHHVSRPEASEQNPIEPLGISPDERSFVRLVFVGTKSQPNLAVTDFIVDKTWLLPIDRARMRFNSTSSIDTAWLDHHFKWEPGEDGLNHLVERTDFSMLPYRGDFELRDYGEWLYSLSDVKGGLAPILQEILRSRFGAQPQASEPGSVIKKFRIGDAEISVHFSDDPGYLMFWIGKETGVDRATEIAAAFNAELATGRHDELFVAKGA